MLFRIKVLEYQTLRNACLNLVNTSLALGIKKSEDFIVFLDLDKF